MCVFVCTVEDECTLDNVVDELDAFLDGVRNAQLCDITLEETMITFDGLRESEKMKKFNNFVFKIMAQSHASHIQYSSNYRR